MDVAIAGAHGQIARRLTRLLAARGDRVRGLIRNPAHADDVRADGAEPVPLDLEAAGPDEVAAAIDGADAVVFAAGAGPGSGAARKMTVDRDGTYTGQLVDVPPTGESRASVLFDYAAAEGIDLAESVAYADSASDLPMLEVVGFPVAVNPETRLAALARKRGWLVEQWSKAPGGPRPMLPIGPLLSARQRRAPVDGRASDARALR